MKPILMFAATAALAFVLYCAFFGRQDAHDSDGTSTLDTDRSQVARPQPPIEAPARGSSSANEESAQLDASGRAANERTAAEPHPFLTALPPPAPAVEGDSETHAHGGEPAYSEPTELLHFALRNSQDVFEAKYREQGKDEFTANLRSLEGVLAAQRSGKVQDRAQMLDAKELEILDERVKWMQAFARRL